MTSSEILSRPARRTAPRRFMVGMSAVFLLLIAAGFGPTFFLLPLKGGTLPPDLVVHGIVLTIWFAWLPLQSILIGKGRHALHRTLGIIGAVIGFAAIATGIAATIAMPARRIARAGGAEMAAMTFQFWINVTALLASVTLLTLAIVYRRRPALHRRLIFTSYVAMMPAPIAHVFGAGTPLVPISVLILFLALIGHDLSSEGRVHRASWIVPVAMFALVRFVIVFVAPSPLGISIPAALASAV